MKYSIASLVFIAALYVSCEKIPLSWKEKHSPGKEIEDVEIFDAQDKPVEAMYAGLQIKIVSEDFIALNKQVDLVKEGVIQFDTLEAPIFKAEKDYIITAVPVMHYTMPGYLVLNIRIRDLLRPLCRRCFFIYEPTVRGSILAGYSGGKPDGNFQLPAEMTLDAAGNIYVIDQRSVHDVVLTVTPDGVVSTYAGAAGEFGRLTGIGIDNARNVMYVADATAQQVMTVNMSAPAMISVLAGSGAPGNADGTGTAASFNFGNEPVNDFGISEVGQGLTVDSEGNIYVGENYSGVLPFGSQLRKITPEGVVTTVAGSRIEPTEQSEAAVPAGLDINGANNIFYVSGSSGFFQGITTINSAGTRTRPAGRISFEGLNDGTGSTAQFSYPKAIDEYNGLLYVADGTNGALRRVSAGGEVITLAGVGHFNTSSYNGGDFLPPLEGSYRMPLIASEGYYEREAIAIRMDQAGGVAVRSNGLIYVSDFGYKCIWKITVW